MCGVGQDREQCLHNDDIPVFDCPDDHSRTASEITALTHQIPGHRSGREEPRTVLIIGDSLDSAVCAHFHPNDSFDRPRRRGIAGERLQAHRLPRPVPAATSRACVNRHRGSRHPRSCRRIDRQRAIGRRRSVRESIPVLAIEPFDVQGGSLDSGVSARAAADRSFKDANFDRPRLRAAFTPPTVESTSSAISSSE